MKKITVFKYLIFLMLCLKSTLGFCIYKEWAMGDLGVAYPQTSIGARYNPAVITELHDRSDLAVGVVYQNGHTKISGSSNPLFNSKQSNTQVKWIPIAISGLVKKISPTLTFGIQGDYTRSASTSCPKGFAFAGKGKFVTDAAIPIILPTIAWKCNEFHSFGISVPIYWGRLRIKGAQNGAFNSISPHNVSNNGYDQTVGFSLRFGWFWHVTPKLDFGFMVQTQALAASHWRKYQGGAPERALLEDAPLYRIGLAYKLNCQLLLTGEVNYGLNDRCRALHNSVHSTAPGGSKHAAGSGWPNVWTLRFGGDYNWRDDIHLRMGYSYITNFISPKNIIGNLGGPVFLLRHILYGGASTVYKEYDVGFATFYAFNRKVRGIAEPGIGGGRVTMNHAYLTFVIGMGKKI